jgi:TolB protein
MILTFVSFLAASSLTAQDYLPAATSAPAERISIAIPPLPTPKATETAIGNTASLGNQVATIIAADLKSTGLYDLSGPDGLAATTYLEATAPAFAKWRSNGVKALVSGFVYARRDGRLNVGCYLYDVTTGREMARQGYAVAVSDWRRAAHKCADAIYARLSGERGMFDSRIAYVAESGPGTSRVKRLAIMDSNGFGHRYLTAGQALVTSPRFSPDGKQLVYTSFLGRLPRVFVVDIASGNERMILPGRMMTFAPRFSPDSRTILFSAAENGNTDLFAVGAYGGVPQRLTDAPGTDTAASFSPDGRQIVFESDRSGTPQLYVMDADGSNQRRISFDGGRYGSPEWSPKGDLIAFVRVGGGIGVMRPEGGDMQSLTNGSQDEAPSFAPNGQFLLFHRTDEASRQASLNSVSVKGGEVRQITTPQPGSDPAWSPLG